MRIPRPGCVALRGLDRRVAIGPALAGLVARKQHLWYIEQGIVVADDSVAYVYSVCLGVLR